MKKDTYADMSTEKLLSTKKSIKSVTGILAGMLTVLFAITLYQSITDKFTPLLIIPFALIPIVVINFINIKAIDKELKSRP